MHGRRVRFTRLIRGRSRPQSIYSRVQIRGRVIGGPVDRVNHAVQHVSQFTHR
jgi:hypothetical protein